jgi:protein-glutamine gamma-glutamyltransferase
VDDFLFNTRAGFCEHFASAFVVLLRAMDIPSRVVTGYQGGELNQVDHFLSVRQSDAHAWAEVWLPGRGWVRIDPTAAVAPERIDSSARSAVPRAILGGLVSLPANSVLTSAFLRLRQDWEALNNRWNQWVLDYSAKRQQNLLEALGFHDTSWRMLAKLLAAAFAVLLAGLTLLLARQRQARDPLQAVYERFAAVLSRHGKQRAPHEGPRGWRERLLAEGGARPEQLRAWSEFLQLYETLRYAPPPAGSTQALQRLKSLLTLCR